MKEKNFTAVGRPSMCTPEVCDEIIERLSNGETLSQMCREPGMPKRTTVLKWRDKNPQFADRYARARRDQMETWSDEIIEISDNGTTDYITKVGRNGVEHEAVDQEHIQRSRLRVDTRKFLMAKIAPHLFGDRLAVEHTGGMIVKHELSDRERMRRMALFLMEDQAAGTVIEHDAGAMNEAGEVSYPTTHTEMDD